MDEQLFLDAALAEERDRFAALTPGDRAAARRLTLTALRRLGEIDAEIDARLAKPLPERGRPIRQILRIAAAETAFAQGAAHAAVDAAVRQAKKVDPRFSGLVNAVARRIAEQAARLAERPAEEAARLNTPAWLWDRLCADWGAPAAARLAAAQLSPPPLDLTLRDPDDAPRWAEQLGAERSPTGGLRLKQAEKALTALPGFEEGAWWVQDAAAALPARLLGATGPGALKGLRVLDLCAAPGGKTMQLAAAGAEVTAVDDSESRMARVSENLARTGLQAKLVTEDA
ncbi:MAG: transcription antitermination factor NusB, partial [Pseudomonadota bacterium]